MELTLVMDIFQREETMLSSEFLKLKSEEGVNSHSDQKSVF